MSNLLRLWLLAGLLVVGCATPQLKTTYTLKLVPVPEVEIWCRFNEHNELVYVKPGYLNTCLAEQAKEP